MYIFTISLSRFRVEVVSVILPTTSLTAQPPVVTTGRLVAQVSLDREERDMYFLTIVAHDVTSQPLNASVPESTHKLPTVVELLPSTRK